VTVVDGRVEIREHPEPVPGRGQLLVRVRAAGLNAADLAQVTGGYPAPPGWPPDIPGIELAGEVVALGEGADGFGVGDRVMALVGGGAQAEVAVVNASEAMVVPDALGWDAAAGLPEGCITAHDALFTHAALVLGDRVLITGAAGGVGTAGVQLAVAAGAEVVASVRDPARRPAVAALGAAAIDPSEVDAHGPYDVILELVGLSSLDAVLPSLAPGGRVCLIGSGVAGTVDLGPLMMCRGRLYGSTLRGRSPADKAAAVAAVVTRVLPLVEAGRFDVPIDSRFTLADAPLAYEHFAQGHKFGKVVLTVEER
jgi:NADPH:quinone reductase-like Zn-dependent oxidoreductase